MELCTQGTLESLIAASESALPEPVIRKYTHQLVKAVAILHQHSIVHRDIKSKLLYIGLTYQYCHLLIVSYLDYDYLFYFYLNLFF